MTVSRMRVRIGNAPVSWGVGGVQHLPNGRTPDDMLQAIAAAGYAGTELGALGLFGSTPAEAVDRFKRHKLDMAGAYVPLRPLHGDEVFAADLDMLRQVCAVLAAFEAPGPIILAEETQDVLKRHVRRGTSFPELDLDTAQWKTFTQGMTRAAGIARDMGLLVSYHPHTGTHVEQPHEVDRLLELTDLDFTLDTGHAAAGGDDPLALLERWGHRVNHVHVKDIIFAPLEEARAAKAPFRMARAAVTLGQGDLDMDGFMSALRTKDYEGWIVVEQDRGADDGHDHTNVDREQQTNLEWVQARIE